jgi:hypothetical protein
MLTFLGNIEVVKIVDDNYNERIRLTIQSTPSSEGYPKDCFDNVDQIEVEGDTLAEALLLLHEEVEILC